MQLLPARMQPYAKAWAALVGAVVVSISAVVTAPTWLTVAGTIATTVGVFLTPNSADRAQQAPPAPAVPASTPSTTGEAEEGQVVELQDDMTDDDASPTHPAAETGHGLEQHDNHHEGA